MAIFVEKDLGSLKDVFFFVMRSWMLGGAGEERGRQDKGSMHSMHTITPGYRRDRSSLQGANWRQGCVATPLLNVSSMFASKNRKLEGKGNSLFVARKRLQAPYKKN